MSWTVGTAGAVCAAVEPILLVAPKGRAHVAIAFAPVVIEAAWERSGGMCECARTSCGHSSRCNKSLVRSSQGKDSPRGWEAHHVRSTGPAVLSNCQILCRSCHQRSRSYARR